MIGYLEPHDRPETAALAEGLEVVPRLRSAPRRPRARRDGRRRGHPRAPELALIDELAHTNAPGMRNEKRYQDIDEILAAGIDVISTVNVQHLESLNDAIFELTGVRVRETFPDRVLDEADEVVLVAPELSNLIGLVTASMACSNADAGALRGSRRWFSRCWRLVDGASARISSMSW